MAQRSVNATRFAPYRNFKFRVTWDGRTRYEAITLERGGSATTLCCSS